MISASFEMVSYDDDDDDDDLDEKEEKFVDGSIIEPIYKKSYKNYFFINTENNIIGVHPSNPTFDFLHIASNTAHYKTKYCISKKYGIFYISNDGKKIYQSSRCEKLRSKKIYEIGNKNCNFKHFKSINMENKLDEIFNDGITKCMFF